jgi:hypothetical protein
MSAWLHHPNAIPEGETASDESRRAERVTAPSAVLNVLLLGPESSGKSSLVLQLRSAAVHRALITNPAALGTSPTTGQEVDSFELRDVADDALWPGERLSGCAKGATRKKEATSAMTTSSKASSSPVSCSSAGRLLTVREVGGRMMSVWPKFVSNFALLSAPAGVHHQHRAPDAAPSAGLSSPAAVVVFVVDVSLPAGGTQLASACVEFQQLLLMLPWPILLLLNKSCAPSVLPALLLRDVFLQGQRHRSDGPSRVTVMEIDTWSGLGLADVFDWLRHISPHSIM